MKIYVTWASEKGPTEIAAFDKALHSAGIADYNLIPLSSVIPTGSEIVVRRIPRQEGEIGHKLYVVLSCRFATVPGQAAWAGLGWAQRSDGSGVFVEPNAETEEDLDRTIEQSIESMIGYRKGRFSSIGTKVVGANCIDEHPACALVCAVYGSEGW